MPMLTHDLQQGSPEWAAYRARMFNASDAPAMLGVSPYKPRAQLLRELHTGVTPDIDTAQHMRFENGHRSEALARPLAEELIGQELYPVTGSVGRLSASFDGLTLDESTAFEHKALNDELRAAFDAIEGGASPHAALPIHHRVQMEQQLLISDATAVLFMASKWDADEALVELRNCWYTIDPALRARIVAGWAQFDRDLAAYTLPPAADTAPVGRAPEALPALRIEVSGNVTASNLPEFKATALAAIRAVNRTLKTDQDFADAERAVKWCAEVEARIKAAKEHALAQTADIETLFLALDEIASEARDARLSVDKLVTRRKAEIKEAAAVKARQALDAHVAAINAEIAPMRLLPPLADFAGAIKGLKSLASIDGKLDAALAAAKIDADTAARAICANAAVFRARADGLEFLFADLGALIHKGLDDFAATVDARIARHKAAEAERQRLAAEAAAALVTATAAAPAPDPIPPPVPATHPATLNLGDICERLGIALSGAFVAETLGVEPARTDKAAKLYTEAQFQAICGRLRAHVADVQASYDMAEAAR